MAQNRGSESLWDVVAMFPCAAGKLDLLRHRRSRPFAPTDDNHFTVSAEVEVSNMFYSWVCSFRKKAVILNPPEVVEGFQQFMSDIKGRY